MKCKCISNLEKELVGTTIKNRNVLKAKFISIALIFGSGSIEAVTTSEVEMELEGRKTKHTQEILHNYCPFCGIKIKEE